MKAIGEFVFKGLEKKAGGSFTNEKGEMINYKEKYVLKVDETVDGQINERKLNIGVDNTELINALNGFKPYQALKLECDVVMYQNSAKVVPVAIVGSNK